MVRIQQGAPCGCGLGVGPETASLQRSVRVRSSAPFFVLGERVRVCRPACSWRGRIALAPPVFSTVTSVGCHRSDMQAASVPALTVKSRLPCAERAQPGNNSPPVAPPSLDTVDNLARLAEWLGAGLQPLLRRFDSDAVLHADVWGRRSTGGLLVCTQSMRVQFPSSPPFFRPASGLRTLGSDPDGAGSSPAGPTIRR